MRRRFASSLGTRAKLGLLLGLIGLSPSALVGQTRELLYDAATNLLYVVGPARTLTDVPAGGAPVPPITFAEPELFEPRKHFFKAGEPVVLHITNARLSVAYTVDVGEYKVPLALPAIRGLEDAESLSNGERADPPPAKGVLDIGALAVDSITVQDVLNRLADPRGGLQLGVALETQYQELLAGFRSIAGDVVGFLTAFDVIRGTPPAIPVLPLPNQGAHVAGLSQGLFDVMLDALALTNPTPQREFDEITERLDIALGAVKQLNVRIDSLSVDAEIRRLTGDVSVWQRKARTFWENKLAVELANALFLATGRAPYEGDVALLAELKRLADEYDAVATAEQLQELTRRYDEFLATAALSPSIRGQLTSVLAQVQNRAGDVLDVDGNSVIDAIDPLCPRRITAPSIGVYLRSVIDRERDLYQASLCLERRLVDAAAGFRNEVGRVNEVLSQAMGAINQAYAQNRARDPVTIPLGIWGGNYLIRFQILEQSHFAPYQLASGPRGIAGGEGGRSPRPADISLLPDEPDAVDETESAEGESAGSNGVEEGAPEDDQALDFLYGDVFEIHKFFELNVIMGGGVSWLDGKRLFKQVVSSIDSTMMVPDTTFKTRETDVGKEPERPLLFMALKVYLKPRDLYPGADIDRWLPAPFIGTTLDKLGGLVGGLAWEPINGVDIGAGLQWSRVSKFDLMAGTDASDPMEVLRDDNREWGFFIMGALDFNIFRRVFGGGPNLPLTPPATGSSGNGGNSTNATASGGGVGSGGF